MSAVPVLQDELDRKVFETLEWLLDGFEGGKLTSDQVSIGADAVFKATAGLTNRENFQIVSEMSSQFPNSRVDTNTILATADNTFIIRWVPGDDSFMVIPCNRGVWGMAKSVDCADIAEARKKMDALIVSLQKKGYMDI